jgi:hypothetical protein
VLREKVKAKVEIEEKDKVEDEGKVEVKYEYEFGRHAPCAMRFAYLNKVKEEAITWIDLILLLDGERSFFSQRKSSGGKILVEKEKS